MSDNLDTLLVEFRCNVSEKDAASNPVKELELHLSKQKRAFAVEEFILKKEDLTSDADWVEWFAAHPNESEAFAAVFLVEKAHKQYFDGLFTEYMTQKEKAANQSLQRNASTMSSSTIKSAARHG